MRTLFSLTTVLTLPILFVSATPRPTPSIAFDVFVECKCVPMLEIDAPEGNGAWTLTWSADDANEVGICAEGYCALIFTPRPCDGDFKVSVGFTPPIIPAPPCATNAYVDYQSESDTGPKRVGELSLVTPVCDVRHVGQTKVPCRKKSDNGGDGSAREGDSTTSQIAVNCGDAQGLNVSRKFILREVCVGCEGPPPLH